MNKEDFINKSKLIHSDKYDYSLVNYVNNKTKIKIICPIHGIFEQKPIKHLCGHGCPECGRILSKRNKLTTEDFINKSKLIHGNEYDYSLVEYINSNIKVKIICSKHGIFEQLPYIHLRGSKCKLCIYERISKSMISNSQEFIDKSKLIHGDKYNYSLVNYKNSHTKVKIICPKHGEFYQFPYSHLNGNGCPNCKKSKGELIIKKYLENNNFIYNEQYRFIDCKNIVSLPFDFYLPNNNIVIEYDGEQHYRKYRFEKDDNNLIMRQYRDKIKTDYCQNNKIKLIRIKYIDMKKIDKILDEYLKNI